MRVTRPEAGMHTIGWLPDGASDRQASRRAAEAGVTTWALSACCRHAADRPPRPGLILGFAAYGEPEIAKAVRTLARVLGRSGDGR